MYECALKKEWDKDKPTEVLPLCCFCHLFMHEGDACLEDSMLTPIYKKLHPESKPCSFAPETNAPKVVKDWFYANQKSKEEKE